MHDRSGPFLPHQPRRLVADKEPQFVTNPIDPLPTIVCSGEEESNALRVATATTLRFHIDTLK
jgi:hypothetical protein